MQSRFELNKTYELIVKKPFYILISVLLGLSGLFVMFTQSVFAGTEENPTVIHTCEQLQAIWEDLEGHYVLGSDIDCSMTYPDSPSFDPDGPWNEHIGFYPIGNNVFYFQGSLDGQGYKITDMYIYGGEDTGLFSQIGSADNQVGSVTDLTIENADITGTWATGALAGYLYGLADNVHIVGGTVSGESHVGGLVGAHMGDNDTILNSSSSADVSGTNGEIGGLVGYNAPGGVIDNSRATGNVTSLGTRAGGLVGDNDGEITDSYATGDIETDSSRAGGLVGQNNSSAEILNSFASGNVTSESSQIGGLVGRNNGLVKNTHAIGNTFSYGASVGGLVGYNLSSGSIENSYATGSVYSDDDFAGGLVGQNRGSINESYADNANYYDEYDEEPHDYSVYAYCDAGGLVGIHNEGGMISNSYSRSDVSSDDSTCGVGGVVGYLSDGGTTVLQSYSTGISTGWDGNNDNIHGGIIGIGEGGSLFAVVWDIETSQRNNACGLSSDGSFNCDFPRVLGATTAEMQDVTTYSADNFSEAEWNFNTIWDIDGTTNDGYPFLRDVGATIQEQEPGNDSSDHNNDGTPDSQQQNVDSVISPITNNRVVLELDEVCEIQSLSVTLESSNTTQDTDYTYNNGLVNFTADCGTPGYETTVTLYHYDVSSSDVVVRKHNPNTNEYFTVGEAVLSDQTINNQQVAVASFSITDGGELDVDGEENGIIVDPVGLASVDGSGGLADTGSASSILSLVAIVIIGVSTLTLIRASKSV